MSITLSTDFWVRPKFMEKLNIDDVSKKSTFTKAQIRMGCWIRSWGKKCGVKACIFHACRNFWVCSTVKKKQQPRIFSVVIYVTIHVIVCLSGWPVNVGVYIYSPKFNFISHRVLAHLEHLRFANQASHKLISHQSKLFLQTKIIRTTENFWEYYYWGVLCQACCLEYPMRPDHFVP